MKLCVAQTRPIKGDIPSNIERHKSLIRLAVSLGAEIIVFPELSITGYEPTLAKELATGPDDRRFDDFQRIADTNGVTLGVGVPTHVESGVSITLVLFQPRQARQTYSKQYLHPDEEPFFVSGSSSLDLFGNQAKIAPAICYETSIAEHAEGACRRGAKTYVASVAKSASGVANAIERLSGIAKTYSMTVLMANCVGDCDNFECGGKSSVWNQQGELVGQLDDTSEGVIVFDTDTDEIIETTI
jgi:predicted amidohydrolase